MKTKPKTTKSGGKSGTGAKGGGGKPAGSDTGPKWKGGGKKGEDEKR